MKKLILATLALGFIITSNCTKQGPIGPQGPVGQRGADGNANVISSDEITVNTWTSVSGSYKADFAYAEITANVADRGVVEIYRKYSDGSWTNLPDINNGVSYAFNFLPGSFTLWVTSVTGLTAVANPGLQVFRVVCIPASVKAAHPNTNWKDYNTAIATLEQAKQEGLISSN